MLKKRAVHLFDDFAYLFGILTASKINRLINKLIISSLESKDKININESDLNKLLKRSKIANKGKVDLHKLLIENGFSNEIYNIKFLKKSILENVDIRKILFKNCVFDGCGLNDLTISEVEFYHCSFKNSSFVNSNMHCVSFISCRIIEAMFINASLQEIVFLRSSIIGSSFENANLIECSFLCSSLMATHFLESTIQNSSIKGSDLQDSVFFNALDSFTIDDQSKRTAKITKPIVSILVDPKIRGITLPKAYMKLDQSAKLIPIRIAMQSPISTALAVRKEVRAVLKKIGSCPNASSSIAKRIIEEMIERSEDYPNSARILNKVKKLSIGIQAVFLPGGEDVPPALYGRKANKATDWGNDYRRSLLELGLIHESFNKGIPLMAVCRGFQIANIYFGAKLKQHVEGHKGVQKFTLFNKKERGLYSTAVKSGLFSPVFHHQAIPYKDRAVVHIEPAIVYKRYVKATELKYSAAAPMILLQFHPEFYNAPTAHNSNREWKDFIINLMSSKKNELFWKIFSESARTYRNRHQMLSQLRQSD